jgi:hypothetical protein
VLQSIDDEDCSMMQPPQSKMTMMMMKTATAMMTAIED